MHEEGLEAAFARHALNHAALAAGLEAIGIGFTAQEGHRLPMLNAVRIPDGVDDAAVRRGLLDRFGIEIGAGLGEFKGKVWRIGLMGHSSRMRTCSCFWPQWKNCSPSKAIHSGPALDRRGESRVRQAVTHKDTKPKRQRYPQQASKLGSCRTQSAGFPSTNNRLSAAFIHFGPVFAMRSQFSTCVSLGPSR